MTSAMPDLPSLLWYQIILLGDSLLSSLQLLITIIHADDVVRQRGIRYHFVTMCACVGGYRISTIKWKLLVGMTWNVAQY